MNNSGKSSSIASMWGSTIIGQAMNHASHVFNEIMHVHYEFVYSLGF